MSRSLVLTLHVPTAKIGKPVNRVNEKKKVFKRETQAELLSQSIFTLIYHFSSGKETI